jgi:hypothetical protein
LHQAGFDESEYCGGYAGLGSGAKKWLTPLNLLMMPKMDI